MDLQNIDLNKAINANLIDKKFGNLKWVTPFFSGTPQEEIDLLKNVIKEIKNDQREKMVITHYQFFSAILEEDLNIPNRWYLNNASHPGKDHKYYKLYKDHFNKNLKKNNISVIYIVGTQKIDNFKIYTNNICFNEKKINKIASVYELEKC
tara:strand:- start:99 stop:551 length:453 start_codon:yes stop_codon:yes gene_type:complete